MKLFSTLILAGAVGGSSKDWGVQGESLWSGHEAASKEQEDVAARGVRELNDNRLRSRNLKGGKKSKKKKSGKGEAHGYRSNSRSSGGHGQDEQDEPTPDITSEITSEITPEITPEIRVNLEDSAVERFKRDHYLRLDSQLEFIHLSADLFAMASAFLSGKQAGDNNDFLMEVKAMQTEMAMVMNMVNLNQSTSYGYDSAAAFARAPSSFVNQPLLTGAMYQNLLSTFSASDVIAPGAPVMQDGTMIADKGGQDNFDAQPAMFGLNGPAVPTGVLIGEVMGCRIFIETNREGQLDYLSTQCQGDITTHLIPYDEQKTVFAIVNDAHYDTDVLRSLFEWADTPYDRAASENTTDDTVGTTDVHPGDGTSNKQKSGKKNKKDKKGGKGGKRRALRSLQEDESTERCSSFNIIELAAVFESSFCAKFPGDSLDEKFQNAKAKVEATVAAASRLYEQSGLCTKIKIVYMEGHCNPATDPYRQSVLINRSGCNNQGVLQGFQRFWRGARGDVARDVAHLFTGTGLECNAQQQCVVGCAYIGSMCSRGGGYGVSYTLFSPDTNLQAVLAAHELGHSAGARHFRGNGGRGYIMSAQVNQAEFGFSQTSIDAILSEFESESCIERVDNPLPPPTPVPTPAPVDPFAPPTLPRTDGGDPANCMAGNTGVLQLGDSSQPGADDKQIKLIKELKVGDSIQGFDEEMRPSACKVEAVGWFGYGEVYSNYTSDHFVLASDGRISAHGSTGEVAFDDRFDVLTSCPLAVDESGTAFTPIDSHFCGAETELSWSDYLNVHSSILRLVRKSGGYWFSASAYHSMTDVKRHLPTLCRTMLQCAKDHTTCEEFEIFSKYFVHSALSDQARDETKSSFRNLGKHQEAGSVSAVVTKGKSVRRTIRRD
jgi:hypothetical protein